MADVQPEASSVGLVYAEIRELLRRQEASLDNARSRSGTILAVVGLALSFFGGAILDVSEDPPLLFWVGVGIVVLGLVLALWVLAPQKETWLFSPNPDQLMDFYISRPEGESKAYLARYMAGWTVDNKEKITAMYVKLIWSVSLSGVGLLVLLAVLAFWSGK